MPKFEIGQRVKRIEDRVDVGSIVLMVYENSLNGYSYLIKYDEGGEGYWPENCLEAE